MAISGISVVSEALKNEYLGAFRNQFNYMADPLLAQLEGDTTMVEGDNIVMALRYGRVGGIAALATDISDLPTPNARKTKQIKFGTKNLMAQIQLSDKVIQISRGSAGAFANLLKQELDDAVEDSKDDLSRQVYGDGAGKLTTTSAASSVNTFGVASTQYLAEGMLVDILHQDGSTLVSEREITAVDDVNNTVTISGAAVTTLVTDYLARAKSAGNELTGLGAVFTDDSTIYGVDRSAAKWMNAQHLAVGGELSNVVIQKGIDLAEKKTGAKINYISCSDGVARAFMNYQESFKRNTTYLELKGGWRAMAYVSPKGELPVVGTKYAPAGKMRLLCLENWHMAQLADWDWMADDGNILSRISGKPAYGAILRKYCDLVCDLPRGQFELTGVTEH